MALLGAAAAALVLGQRSLTYVPDTSDPGSVTGLVDGSQDVTLRTEDGLDLSAWLVEPTGADRAVAVLYLPGNGGNRAGRLPAAQAMAAEGFTVLLLDYRGYGANPGRPTADGLLADAEAGVALLREAGFGAARTVYYGESLGTAVAASLIAVEPAAGAVLRSPFPSLAAVADATFRVPVGRLLTDSYPAAEHLSRSDVPVRVLYGEADTTVPPHLSRELADSVGNLQDVVAVPGAGHNDAVWWGPLVAEQVALLVEQAGAD